LREREYIYVSGLSEWGQQAQPIKKDPNRKDYNAQKLLHFEV